MPTRVLTLTAFGLFIKAALDKITSKLNSGFPPALSDFQVLQLLIFL